MTRFLGLRGAKLGTVISATCGLCFLCFGYAQGVLGGLLTVPAFLDRFPQIDTLNNPTTHTARLQGITVGTWNLGCFASALLTVFLGDHLGRRKTLLLGLVLWTIGEIVQCSSYSFGQFIAGRFIAGFGNGFTTSTVPAYQAECVKSHRKGTMLMISAGAFIAFGLALSYWLVFAFAYVGNIEASWRVPIAFQIIFALVAAALLIFLPESPRWLILTGREQEALTVLAALNDDKEDSPDVRDEFLQIKDAIIVMAKGSPESMLSNKDRRGFHRVFLAYFVQVFQQISGINLSLQYLSIMFAAQQSYTPWVARLLGGCASTEYFLASFVAVVGIDRFWGRRSLMMFGATGMCICMVLLAVLGYLWEVKNVSGTNIAGSVFLFGFSTFFAIGWQGMAWLYQVEVVPLRIRGAANAWSTSANWLFNFVVVLIAPIAFHNIGYRTYIIFACTNFAIVPLVYFFCPETAYRSLEEVDMLFQLANETSGNPWLNVVKISKSEPLWFGRRGEEKFDYSRSEWHQRFENGRWSMSSGTTLAPGEKGHNTSPSNGGTAKAAPSNSPEERTPPDGLVRSHSTSSNPLGQHPVAPRPYQQHTKNKDSVASAMSTASAHAKKKAHGRHNISFHSTKSSHKSTQSGQSMMSAYTDPDWASSDMAPPPLCVSSSRPGTGSSKASGGASDPGWYPGRLGPDRGDSGVLGGGDGRGISRGGSPRDTYSSGGLESPNLHRRSSFGSQSTSSRYVARDAGRGG